MHASVLSTMVSLCYPMLKLRTEEARFTQMRISLAPHYLSGRKNGFHRIYRLLIPHRAMVLLFLSPPGQSRIVPLSCIAPFRRSSSTFKSMVAVPVAWTAKTKSFPGPAAGGGRSSPADHRRMWVLSRFVAQ